MCWVSYKIVFWSGANTDPSAPHKSILSDVFYKFPQYTDEEDVDGYEAIAKIINLLGGQLVGLDIPTNEKICAHEYPKNRNEGFALDSFVQTPDFSLACRPRLFWPYACRQQAQAYRLYSLHT